jgi:N-acyl-D-amino-acid deacylase
VLDVLIRNGRVIDGTGNPWIHADVGVQGDRIVALGRLGRESARRTIDADGLYVCPGFVDMHTHSDLALLAQPTWECKVMQGVTLEVLGQDGLGLAPVTDETREVLHGQLMGWNGPGAGVRRDWHTMAEYLDRFDGKVTPNVAALVGHGTVRMAVIGLEDRAPTPSELARMRHLVAEAMRDGAVGLSAGLTYSPGMYGTDDEVVALCEAVHPYGGYYQPHHRNYGSRALEGYAASLDIGRRAGVPVHLTHALMNFPINRGRAGEMLALVDQARSTGLEVTLDTYPYLAGMSYLHAPLPSWVHAGGGEAILARLQNPDLRGRIRGEMEAGSDGFNGMPIDWAIMVIAGASLPANRPYVGLSIREAATRAGTHPFDFYCDLLVAERLGVGSLTFAGNEENVRAIMQHPAHTAGSDGITIGDRPHPRAWGTFARYLAEYVRGLGLVRLEDMVRKMTWLPCRRLGFEDRGVIRVGAAADLVCFDADRVQDTATYESPRQHPAGIPYVFVNGVVVKDGDHHMGATPGRALRKPAP